MALLCRVLVDNKGHHVRFHAGEVQKRVTLGGSSVRSDRNISTLAVDEEFEEIIANPLGRPLEGAIAVSVEQTGFSFLARTRSTLALRGWADASLRQAKTRRLPPCQGVVDTSNTQSPLALNIRSTAVSDR